MKRHFLLTILLVLCLSACSAPAAPSSPTAPLPSATVAPTDTPAPAPTATATNTPIPTSTPLPTATFTPTATPTPVVISLENSAGLQLVQRYGNGRVLKALWSPRMDRLMVLTTVHLKAFDPDGNPLWETETASVQKMMAFTPDGGSVATLSADGAVTLWDAASGKVLKTLLKPQDNIDFAVLSANTGLAVLSNSTKATTAWDVNSAAKLGSNDGNSLPRGIDDILVAPDGSEFWLSGFGSNNAQLIQAWDAKTGSFTRSLQGIGLHYVVSLALSPDGKAIVGISRLALSSKVEYSLMTWDAASGRLLNQIPFSEDIDAFAFVPGQTLVMVASYGGISAVDYKNGGVAPTSLSYSYQSTNAVSLDVSSTGKRLAAVYANGNAVIYDLANQASVKLILSEVSLSVPPYILVGKNYPYRMDLFASLGVDTQGKYVAVLSPERTSVDLLDPLTFKVIRSVGSFPLGTFAVSPDGGLIGVTDLSNRIMVYKTSGDSVISFSADNKNYIHTLQFSPDGKLLATLSGGGLGELYLWDVSSGKKVKTLSGYNTMHFSKDGSQLVTDNVDFGLYVWDIASGKKVASPSADWIYDMDFSPDGKTMAVAGAEIHSQAKERQNLVTFYDAQTNTLLPLTLAGHPTVIVEVVYSPDGKLVATADIHGTMRLWNASSGEMLKEVREATTGPIHMAFLPDGRTLVLGGGDGTLRFYQVK